MSARHRGVVSPSIEHSAASQPPRPAPRGSRACVSRCRRRSTLGSTGRSVLSFVFACVGTCVLSCIARCVGSCVRSCSRSCSSSCSGRSSRRCSARCSSRRTRSCGLCCVSRRIGRCYPGGGLWAAHSPAELWSDSDLPLHMGGSRVFGARRQGCRFSREMSGASRSSRHYRLVLAEVTTESGCGSKHSNQDCAVWCRPEPGNRLHIERAARRRNQLAVERASQRGAHSRTQSGTDSGAEVPSLCGVGCDVEGATGCRVEPRVRRGAERRAKSLIDGHIDGRVVPGLEPRSQPGSDPPLAGSNLG